MKYEKSIKQLVTTYKPFMKGTFLAISTKTKPNKKNNHSVAVSRAFHHSPWSSSAAVVRICNTLSPTLSEMNG